jgi:hypothetical protein
MDISVSVCNGGAAAYLPLKLHWEWCKVSGFFANLFRNIATKVVA